MLELISRVRSICTSASIFVGSKFDMMNPVPVSLISIHGQFCSICVGVVRGMQTFQLSLFWSETHFWGGGGGGGGQMSLS